MLGCGEDESCPPEPSCLSRLQPVKSIAAGRMTQMAAIIFIDLLRMIKQDIKNYYKTNKRRLCTD
jgi:hypothetical protein